MRADIKPEILIVMGVSGTGKTTVAAMLAGRLGWPFEEGDDLHPPANVEKMSRGVALDDDDRAPWLAAIARVVDAWRAKGAPGIITCSALKRRYRTIIIGDRPGVRLVYLKGSRAVIAERLAKRQGHFMPAGLLDSQLATLEEPAPDEHAIIVEIGGPPDAVIDRIVDALA
jgi:carbohydrate kinase (thermoresistant glucokinase family)